MKIFIGADHAGFKLKEHLKKFLKSEGHQINDRGNLILEPKDDYPDFAAKVSREVVKSKESKGILVCGSAEGICIAANKIKGIRAVAVWSLKNAKLSREHNDANVLCLSGWEISSKKAEQITLSWLSTKFSGEERHKRRIKKIKELEK